MEFKNTLYLQHTSVLKVMLVLGYQPCGLSVSQGFKKTRRYVEGVNFISLKDAQKIHNNASEYWDILGFEHLNITRELYQIALQEKLVERTYLLKNKTHPNLGNLLVQQHQVKFTEKGKEYVLEGKAGSVYSWTEELFKGE